MGDDLKFSSEDVAKNRESIQIPREWEEVVSMSHVGADQFQDSIGINVLATRCREGAGCIWNVLEKLGCTQGNPKARERGGGQNSLLQSHIIFILNHT